MYVCVEYMDPDTLSINSRSVLTKVASLQSAVSVEISEFALQSVPPDIGGEGQVRTIDVEWNNELFERDGE